MIDAIEHLNYNRLSDDVYLIGNNAILKMNVSLYTSSKDNRYNYHHEYMYKDPKTGEMLISLKRSFDYYLSIENIRAPKEFIRIGMPDIMMLISGLKKAVRWFSDKEYEGLFAYDKDNTIVLGKRIPPIEIYPLPMQKYIVLEPIIITMNNNEQQTGVRMYLNSTSNFVDVSVYRFMGFVQVLSSFNLYIAAQNLLNYLGRPEYGANLVNLENINKTDVEDGTIVAKTNTTVKKNVNRSVFDPNIDQFDKI